MGGLGRGIRIGAALLGAGTAAAVLAACARRDPAAEQAGGAPRPRRPDDAPRDEANAPAGDAAAPGSSTPGPAPSATPTPAGGAAPGSPSNWAPEAAPALEQLATTRTGTRLLDAWRAGGKPIAIDDALATPAQFESHYVVRDGVREPATADRIAIRSDAVVDAKLGATVLAHELTHYAVAMPGPLHDAVMGAASLSPAARQVLDETMAYVVQREMIEQLQPRTDEGYSYEGHSSEPDGHDRDGVPKFRRRTLVATFDAIASDPTYTSLYRFTPEQLRSERPAIIAALEASVPELAKLVPREHITVQ